MGSGNYSSGQAKENARLRKELQDTKDALEILKKPSALFIHSDRRSQYIYQKVINKPQKV